jgi:hypothetical protein
MADDEPMPRFLLTSLLAAAALAVPATASAADTLIAPDPAAQQIAALDGTVVWVSGKFGNQTLMQRASDGTVSAVKGAPTSRNYRSIDLGRSRSNTLVLTYLRCDSGQSCKPISDDLAGHRATFSKLTRPGCTVNAGPSQWRRNIAYGLFCTGSAANRKRSGLYWKADGSAPRRLPLPKDAVKFAITNIASVDLRGTRVAAVAADIYEYSFSETLAGKDLRSFFAAASEGDSDEHARGLAIESSSTWWTLTNASHSGDPNETIIVRQFGLCQQREVLASAPDAEFLATDLAVDGATLYLLVPNTGIVTHTPGGVVSVACP